MAQKACSKPTPNLCLSPLGRCDRVPPGRVLEPTSARPMPPDRAQAPTTPEPASHQRPRGRPRGGAGRGPPVVVRDDVCSLKILWSGEGMVDNWPRSHRCRGERGMAEKLQWGDLSIPYVDNSPKARARGKRDISGWVRGVKEGGQGMRGGGEMGREWWQGETDPPLVNLGHCRSCPWSRHGTWQ